MRASEYRTGEVAEPARAPMYNHNGVEVIPWHILQQIPVDAFRQAILDVHTESADGLESEFDISYYKRGGNETAYCNP